MPFCDHGEISGEINSWFSCDVIIFQNNILDLTFPSGVLVSSDKRPYRNLTFHNVLARQGRKSALLNFRAFALRDMKIVTREGCRIGQKMTYHFSFC